AGASSTLGAPCPPHVSSAPPGRLVNSRDFPRVALRLRLRSTRGNSPAPLRGGGDSRRASRHRRALPVPRFLRPFGAGYPCASLPRVALRLRLRSTRGNSPAPLRGGGCPGLKLGPLPGDRIKFNAQNLTRPGSRA